MTPSDLSGYLPLPLPVKHLSVSCKSASVFQPDLKSVSVALKCKYQPITRLHLMWSLKQNLLKPFKCLPICLEMRWKNIKGEHWCFKHRLLVITEEWAEGLPTVGHFISEQIYIEQSIFAQVNHFCTAYMCGTGALHACNDKVTGWWWWGVLITWFCVDVCVSVLESRKKTTAVELSTRWLHVSLCGYPKLLAKGTWLTLRRARTHARCRVCAVQCAATNVHPASLLVSRQWFKSSCTVENRFPQLQNLGKTVTQVLKDAQQHLWAS